MVKKRTEKLFVPVTSQLYISVPPPVLEVNLGSLHCLYNVTEPLWYCMMQFCLLGQSQLLADEFTSRAQSSEDLSPELSLQLSRESRIECRGDIANICAGHVATWPKLNLVS